MSTKPPREQDASPTSPAERPATGRARARDDSRKERRSRHRVGDDQGTGQGSQSALSKLKMLERHRASVRPHG